MLKKSAALLLSVLYLVTATGFALNLHFCGDTVTAVSINSVAKAPAGCADGMSCCSSKHLLIKVKDVHIVQAHHVPAQLPAISLAPVFPHYLSFNIDPAASRAFLNKPPPGPALPGINLFLKHQVFRI